MDVTSGCVNATCEVDDVSPKGKIKIDKHDGTTDFKLNYHFILTSI